MEQLNKLTRLLIEAEYFDSHVEAARFLIRNGIVVDEVVRNEN